jgi:hypothetical protein
MANPAGRRAAANSVSARGRAGRRVGPDARVRFRCDALELRPACAAEDGPSGFCLDLLLSPRSGG